MRFQGRVVLVTGGASGIGREVSLALAREGAAVGVADLDEAGAVRVAEEAVRSGGKAVGLATNVADRPSVRKAVEACVARWGGLDHLVCSAGWDRIEPFMETSEEVMRKVVDVNLWGVIYACREALEVLLPRRKGSIVTIASDAGRVGSTGEAVYSAAKGGVIALTKTLARETARHGIRVNCVCPGPTDTPLLKSITQGEKGARVIEAILKGTPIRRLATPSDIAQVVAFFLADEAGFVTGQVLSVSGGLTMAG